MQLRLRFLCEAARATELWTHGGGKCQLSQKHDLEKTFLVAADLTLTLRSFSRPLPGECMSLRVSWPCPVTPTLKHWGLGGVTAYLGGTEEPVMSMLFEEAFVSHKVTYNNRGTKRILMEIKPVTFFPSG